VNGELVLQAYEACDFLWGSDHKPVAAVFRLNLLPSRQRLAIFQRASDSFKSQSTEDTLTALNPFRGNISSDSLSYACDPILFKLRINHFRLNLDLRGGNSIMSPEVSELGDSTVDSSTVVDDHNTLPPPAPPKLNSSFLPSDDDHSGVHDSHDSGTPERSIPRLPPPPPASRLRSNSNGSQSLERSISRVVICFPLPSEIRAKTATAVKRLDHALSENNPSRSSTLLPGATDVSWDDALNNGVEITTVIDLPSPDGTLHALIKLVDNAGNPLAQGVFPVPR